MWRLSSATSKGISFALRPEISSHVTVGAMDRPKPARISFLSIMGFPTSIMIFGEKLFILKKVSTIFLRG